MWSIYGGIMVVHNLIDSSTCPGIPRKGRGKYRSPAHEVIQATGLLTRLRVGTSHSTTEVVQPVQLKPHHLLSRLAHQSTRGSSGGSWLNPILNHRGPSENTTIWKLLEYISWGIMKSGPPD
ncbi:hypothetical protein GDO81_023832 [Engystomops pustulosus]|uniref:Uncharacterized protein n=1 Tax=Engystomops pustulosus TaxID=76066 RepID=A0AAV6YSC1_ENGPU|nr:hypothetical protein GDO81_023832 [Engystomops pustulosus]